MSPLMLLVALLLTWCSVIPLAFAQNEGDEFVNEILEEERKHYGGRDDPYLRDEDVLNEQHRKAQADENWRQAQAEQIQLQREAAFQKDLAKMNQEQQKKARAQKKKDAAVVSGLLKAYQQGDFYGVLGLHFFEFQTLLGSSIWGSSG